MVLLNKLTEKKARFDGVFLYYKDSPAYTNGVSESLFKVGMCLPSGPYVSDEDVKYIVDSIKSAIC